MIHTWGPVLVRRLLNAKHNGSRTKACQKKQNKKAHEGGHKGARRRITEFKRFVRLRVSFVDFVFTLSTLCLPCRLCG
jgi:hypothetical protein